MEWWVLEDFELVLEIPHTVQQSMSSESRPVLGHTIPAFEVLWHNGSSFTAIYLGLCWAREYYDRMGHSCAYSVAMFVDPCIALTWIEKYWDPDLVMDVKNNIKSLMEEYRAEKPHLAPQQATCPQHHGTTLATKYGLPGMKQTAAPKAQIPLHFGR
ncbi:uncharacterized protein F5891DRAFT_978325 [Suillus fuscotomentosus]|uniref:Uncharacterized protein n=1 Tax=Suillus fuscotomentosus TaxID=1912939 RepID=A0AAD4EBE4_9AGAM|nr:uncharacterized protein F5891DRAFT_978325 [Suillus fuscotomentosus]KAG1902851.1 hypothetical protein F5891DRAFT_978325 [Suillus fuscotomentosus]